MGADNIYKRLMNAINNPYGVCGLMGNIQAESGMRSNNMQNPYESRLGMTDESYTQAVDTGTYTNFETDCVGYGLCQWTSSGRKAGLLAYARTKAKSIGDEDMQIDYLLHELSTSYKNVLSVLKTAKTVKEASDCVVTKFEKPKSVLPESSESVRNKTLTARQKLGEEIFAKYGKDKEVTEPMKKIIAIDAGHGKNTSGKRCLKSIDPNQTREWVLNDRIADRLEALLSAYDCMIVRVDDTTGTKDVSLSSRVKKANDAKADVYISIHHNAGLGGKSGGGTIVYYCSSKSEREIQAKKLYDDVISRTGLVGNRSTKIKNYGFYVIKNTKMPAFLIENGFMDSPTDTPIILTAEHAEKTAQGILSFLVDEYALKKKSGCIEPTPQPSQPTGTSYKIKVTADVLNVRAGAGTSYNVNTTVKKNQVYTITEEKNGWGRLKSGAGWIYLKYTEKV